MMSFGSSLFLALIALFSFVSRSLQTPVLDSRVGTSLVKSSTKPGFAGTMAFTHRSPTSSPKPLIQVIPTLHFEDIESYLDEVTVTTSTVELHFSHHQRSWEDKMVELLALPCFMLAIPHADGSKDGIQKAYFISGVDIWPTSLIARLSIQSASCSDTFESMNIELGSSQAGTNPEPRHQKRLGKRSQAADPGIPKSKGCEDTLVYDPPANLTGPSANYVKGVSRVDLVAAGWDDKQIAQYEESHPGVEVI